MYEIWDEWKARHEICEVGRRLYQHFFVGANDGNISVRLSDNEMVITPTGVSKGFMKPEDVVKMSFDGEVIYAWGGFKPSTEFRMHLSIYQHRPDVRAIVHAHPPTATGFAVAGVGLQKPFLSEIVVRTGEIPVVPYAIPGGDELPDSLTPYLKDHNTLLMGNHGVVTYASALMPALFNLETVELYARIYLTAHQLGNINFLNDEQIAALRARYL